MRRLQKNQKRIRLGFQLFVSHDHGKTFDMIDGFFGHRGEAETYRDHRYPTLPFRVRSLRVSCVPLDVPASRDRRVA